MTGKVLAFAILITAVVAGAGLYYLQIYHFYRSVTPSGTDDVQITARASGAPEAIPYTAFEAIDAESSPIRYRACFSTTMDQATLQEDYEPYDAAEPLVAPGWFDCFDAETLGAQLEDGRAHAFLGQKNIRYGIDRIVAITGQGKGYVWHQINHCGEVVFDGRPAPADCPEPPEGY